MAGLAVAIVAVGVGSAAVMKEGAATAASCPPGYKPAGANHCMSLKHPESLFELEIRSRQTDAVRSAPHAKTHPGAFSGALEERAAMPRSVPGSEGTWRPVGHGPLIANGEDYSSVNGLGLANLMGRHRQPDLRPGDQATVRIEGHRRRLAVDRQRRHLALDRGQPSEPGGRSGGVVVRQRRDRPRRQR